MPERKSDWLRAMRYKFGAMVRWLGQLLLCLAFVSAGSTVASSQQVETEKVAPIATAARLGGDNAKTRFVAELDKAIGYNVYVIPDPFRVILDLPQVEFRIPNKGTDRGRGLVSRYRFGRIDDERSRIVLDTTGPVLIDRSFVLKSRNGQPARIVVDMIRTDRKTFDELHRTEQPQPPPAPLSAMAALNAGEDPQVYENVPDAAVDRPIAPAALDEPPAQDAVSATEKLDTTSPPPPEGPVRTIEPKITATADADPLPLPRPRPSKTLVATKIEPVTEKRAKRRRGAKHVIVLDPGHGGIDPGALSKGLKTREKNIVLEFALRLEKKLNATGKYKIVLTRSDDRFLTLRERVKVARNADADLFVAIHADSIRGRATRGATVYTVSEKASDREAAELAQMENRADIIAGVDLGTESDEIAGILIDLAQRETKNYSIAVAKKVVHHMKPVTRLNSRPLRSAGFRVLKAPDIPSILLELGYLSNREDERLLNSKAWQNKVAGALTKAIASYFATQLASGN